MMLADVRHARLRPRACSGRPENHRPLSRRHDSDFSHNRFFRTWGNSDIRGISAHRLSFVQQIEGATNVAFRTGPG
jgi:hypothetical protein